jgi:hypothetical protein
MHGGNESVDADELERCTAAEALLFAAVISPVSKTDI